MPQRVTLTVVVNNDNPVKAWEIAHALETMTAPYLDAKSSFLVSLSTRTAVDRGSVDLSNGEFISNGNRIPDNG